MTDRIRKAKKACIAQKMTVLNRWALLMKPVKCRQHRLKTTSITGQLKLHTQQLDKELERLLNHLDKEIGGGEYVVFLTPDHGVTHIPSFLQSLNIPDGIFSTGMIFMML